MQERQENETGVFTCSDHLLEFVACCDEPCPVCGYSLRGLAEPRCPECGSSLELRVGSPQLRVGPWAVALVSFALGLGFDGVVSLLMTIALILDPTTSWEPIGVVSGFTVLAGAMLIGLVRVARSRPTWTRRTVRTQRLLAAVVFGCVGGIHAMVGTAFILKMS